MMNRCSAVQTTGSSRTSWTGSSSPGATARFRSRLTRARTSDVPMQSRTLCQCFRGSEADGRMRSSASKQRVGEYTPFRQTTSPRASSSTAIPERLAATLWPAKASSTERPWTWRLRMRPSRPEGKISTSSPVRAVPR